MKKIFINSEMIGDASAWSRVEIQGEHDEVGVLLSNALLEIKKRFNLDDHMFLNYVMTSYELALEIENQEIKKRLSEL